MLSINEALLLVFFMGAMILFCRAFPFIFFAGNQEKAASTTIGQGSRKEKILNFVEKTVPPVAMTVLAFNALGGAFRDSLSDGFLVLAASVFTVVVHLWKRNALVSIFGGTALYMLLVRL